MAANGNPPLIKQPLTKNNEGRRNKLTKSDYSKTTPSIPIKSREDYEALERSFKERRIQVKAENSRTYNDNAPILGSLSHTKINEKVTVNNNNNNHNHIKERDKKSKVYNNQNSSLEQRSSQINVNDNSNLLKLNNRRNNQENLINDTNNKRKESVEEKKKTNNIQTSLTSKDSQRNIKNDAELNSSKNNKERFINDTDNNIKESVEENKNIDNNQTSSLIREYSQGNIKNNAGKERSAEYVSVDLTKPVSTQLNINIDSRSSIKLHSLYSTLSKPVSLKNSYANCYLNSALQGISSCYLFVEEINQIKSKNTLFKMLVFRSLINSLSQCSSLAMDISRNEIFQEWNKTGQQDSYELLAYMINQVYNELRSKKEEEGELEKRNLNQWLKVPLPMRILMQYDIKCYCKKTSKSPLQSDLAFHLSMNRSMSRNNLQMLFNNFFNEEFIEDYECDDSHCVRKQATRQVKLHAPLPKTICIHLQRTYWDGFSMRKIDNKVEFNDNLIIKESFCVNDINSEKDQKFKDEKYTLKSVIVHHGNVSFGHYICYKLFHEDWYYTSDSSVHKVAWREVSGCEAYILFYENTSVT